MGAFFFKKHDLTHAAELLEAACSALTDPGSRPGPEPRPAPQGDARSQLGPEAAVRENSAALASSSRNIPWMGAFFF